MPLFPAPPAALESTPQNELDAMLQRLADNKEAWASVSVPARIELLKEIRLDLAGQVDRWCALMAAKKGFGPESRWWGEEYLGGIVPTFRNIDQLIEVLYEIRDKGAPGMADYSQRADGRVVVPVMPRRLEDYVLLTGVTAEVWMDPEVTPSTLGDNVAKIYRERSREGKVALVLGAGNQASIPPMDVLYKLFVENEVCLLKMNPVNDFLGPVFEAGFKCLADRGFFEVCYGGADVGGYLCEHPLVETLHVTGSDRTYDAIVWGVGEDQERRKAANDPKNTRPFSAELGNITPIIIVPGKWSSSQMQMQAERVASMITNNASFNCVAAKMIVTAADWPQRQQFIQTLKAVLRNTPNRKAYYPGAVERFETLLQAHPSAEQLTRRSEDVVPWTWIPELDPTSDALAFTMEPFCAVTSEVALPGSTAVDFLPNAVAFCNEKLWGTLGSTLIISNQTRKRPDQEAAFQEALDDLIYGTIGVNLWPAVSYGIGYTSWGGHPGHTPLDIGSGTGVVHNTRLFDRPQKSVAYGPFVPPKKQPWLHTFRTANRLAPRLVELIAHRRLRVLPNIAWHFVRG